MPQTIEVVVRMTMSEEDFDVHRLEERAKQAGDEVGRQLWVQALEVLDAMALEAPPGAVRPRRVERGWDTPLGPLRFQRWPVKPEGKASYWRDRLLGRERYRRVTPAVKRRARNVVPACGPARPFATLRVTHRAPR